jgi:GT2 family glycosyltransferase
MTAPLVSVVMPFKDAGPFLVEAVESVLAQTLDELELLLVDDGGRDGSDQVAARLAASASRVRVLQHPGRMNLGTSAARALGVAHATGVLVAFLDADDRWDPGHLRHEVDLLQAHPEAAMVCGRAWRWWSWADGDARDVLTPLAFPPGTVVAPPRMLAAVLRQGALTTPTCSLLVRREALRATGGPPEGFGSLFEDQVVNTQLQLRFPAVMSGATTAWYRQHGRSATALAIRRAPTTRSPPARAGGASWPGWTGCPRSSVGPPTSSSGSWWTLPCSSRPLRR